MFDSEFKKIFTKGHTNYSFENLLHTYYYIFIRHFNANFIDSFKLFSLLRYAHYEYQKFRIECVQKKHC